MLPNTNRYGDLLREFYDGIKSGNMDAGRLSEIQRIFNELSDREAVYRSWVNGSARVKFPLLTAQEGDFNVPTTRGVSYSGATGTIANNTWTDVALPTARGYNEFSNVAMIWKSGTTSSWVRNPIVPANKNIFMAAQIVFPVGGAISAWFGATFDFYYNGSYTGSLGDYANYHPADIGSTGLTPIALTPLRDNEEVRLSVKQTTGAAVALNEAELMFCVM